MNTFKHLWLPAACTLLFATTACRDRDDQRANYKPVEPASDRDRTTMPDPAEPERPAAPIAPDPVGPTPTTPPTADTDTDTDTFAQTRDQETSELRTRLSRLDDRIVELRRRGDEEATELANDLHARRDELAERLDRAGEQTASAWEDFKRETADSLDKLEDEIDEAF